MMSTIERKPQQRRVPPLAGPVGNSKTNQSNDVKVVQSLLSFVGLLPKAKEVMPSGILDASDDTAIRTFQRQNNLREDGILNPGGETEQALKKAAQPNQEETEDVSLEAFQKRRAREREAEQKQRMQEAAQEISGKVKSKEENPAPPTEREPDGMPEDMRYAADQEADTPKPDRKPVSAEAEAALIRAQGDLERFNNKDYSLAARFLSHYIGRTGEPITLTAADIEGASLYREAIQTNQRRFEEAMTKGIVDRTYEWKGNAAVGNEGTPSLFRDQILNMKDGETIALQNPNIEDAGDSWDRDIGRIHSIWKDPDHGNAIGAVKLRSTGNFQATRKGSIIEITGEVDHSINDIYDFNNDTTIDRNLFEDYRILAEEGHAVPFEVHGSKKMGLSATLEIKDGNITNPKFEWKDLGG